MIYKNKNKCRICKSKKLFKYLDFGNMTLANSHTKVPNWSENIKIPLAVNYCRKCSNSQLSVVVAPEYMFSNYLYHSAVSKTFQEHCYNMSKDLKKLYNNRNNLLVLDIASNDGSLLKEFKSNDFNVIGIDPAKNLTKIANSNGIKTYCGFWNLDIAKKIVKENGKLDIITATNVFAHVDDLNEFVKNIEFALSKKGIFVIEFPYMKNLMKDIEFDTIYHEHLSYLIVKPLIKLFKRYNMEIADLIEFDIHGGTVRIIVKKTSNEKIKTKTEVIDRFILNEKNTGLHTLKTYEELNSNAKTIKKEFLEFIKQNKDKKIVAYGASAKGNTFLNYCGLSKKDINFIVDDTLDKQGLFFSGTDIPIVSYENIKKENPDYIVILAWNFAKEIMDKTQDFKNSGGKYVIAIPKLKII